MPYFTYKARDFNGKTISGTVEAESEEALLERLHRRNAVPLHVDRINEPDREHNVKYFIKNPPLDTRAYFRSQCLKRYGDHVSEANWDVLIFRNVDGHKNKIIPLMDPLKGTKNLVGPLFENSPDPATLLKNLAQ